MDPHYEGLVDRDCAPPFLRDASSIPIGCVYEKGGAQTLNCSTGERCRCTSVEMAMVEVVDCLMASVI